MRALPLAAALATVLSGESSAAVIDVTDASAGGIPGACTLVDAVAAVNTQAMVNACAAGDGNDDTISLQAFDGTPTVITFTAPAAASDHALALTRPVTLAGTVDSATGQPYVTIERSSSAETPQFGLFESSADLRILALSLRNGSVSGMGGRGGAIDAAGALYISSSVISSSSAQIGGAIAASGDVDIEFSTISGCSADAGGAVYAYGGATVLLYSSGLIDNVAGYFGGGIAAYPALTVAYSTITGNQTLSSGSPLGSGGGGIYGNAVTITHSTISGNTSGSEAGGIYGRGLVTLTNSTISGNTAANGAGGGIYGFGGTLGSGSTISGNRNIGSGRHGGGFYGSTLTLTNSTITGNSSDASGGGVYAENVSLAYCTVSDNAAPDAGGGVMFTVSAVANGSILYGNAPDDINSTVNTNALTGGFDLVGTAPIALPADTVNCNPMLGPFANFGGATRTLPLESGSCAINAASDAPTSALDQRGFARPVGTHADIGAFEKQDASDPEYLFIDGFD